MSYPPFLIPAEIEDRSSVAHVFPRRGRHVVIT